MECNVAPVTECPSPAPVYADVQPIFQQRCVVCHSPGSSGEWPLDNYVHIADWQADIRSFVLACIMPPPSAGIPITVEERTAILTWIRCGLPQ